MTGTPTVSHRYDGCATECPLVLQSISHHQMGKGRTMRRFSDLRTSRQFLAALVCGLLATIVLTMPAMAGVTWCRADPIVRVHGYEIQMWVGVPEGYEQYVNGPISFKIDTPPGIERKVIFTDEGFNGYGETVTWGDTWGQAKLTVKVPMNQAALGAGVQVPVELTIKSPWGTQVMYGTHTGTYLSVPLY
jgi:hypothetical protein